MEEKYKNVDPSVVKVTILILTMLPLVYLIILTALSSIAGDNATETPQPDPALDILPIILIVVGLIELGVAFFYFFPKAISFTKKEPSNKNASNAYTMTIIGYITLESIAIYGLLIGLLQIFVTGDFSFIIPLLFIVLSWSALIVSYVTHVPKILQFVEQTKPDSF